MTPQSEDATDATTGRVTLSVSNLGGIDATTVEFTPGVTILTGRNATNRTSLLRALNGGLGGTAAELKSDAESGYVALELGDDEFVREYERTPAGIERQGTPYTDAETLVDSFVTLLEDNPARRAVERGDDPHDVIMRPVDTGAIERRIRELSEEKRALESEIDRVEERRDDLPRLEERRQTFRAEIEDIDEKVDELREEVADFEADAETAEDADELVDELDEHRQQLRNAEDDIELVESELDALHDDLETAREDRESLPDVDDGRSEIETELESLRQQKRQLDDTISSLSTIVEFNDDLLDDDGYDLPGIEPDDDVTADLAPAETRDVVCWTCGSHVERSGIRDRLDDLRTVVDEKRSERTEQVDRIDELEERLRTLDNRERRESELDQKIERTERKIEQREDRLDDLESTVSGLREEIQTLETEVAETEALRENDLLETYERLSDLQYERGQKEQALADVETEIKEIEGLPSPDELEEQIDEVTGELEHERTRIADLETAAVEQFNDHMDEILDVLGFAGIARVWIERKTDDGGRGPPETQFTLNVVREDDDGTVYEDVVDHLSESEREVVGLVVALAGFLAHDAYEVVPFMLLDSLEAIDGERIADLVEYFSAYAPHLVVALLPDDAAALPEDHQRITADALAS